MIPQYNCHPDDSAPVHLPRTRLGRLLPLLIPGTIRGRYLALAISGIAVLVAAATLATQAVRATAYQNRLQLDRIAIAGEQLRDLSNDVWQLEMNLQQYMLVPDDELRKGLMAGLEHLAVDSRQLAEASWLDSMIGRGMSAASLLDNTVQLQKHVTDLTAIRTEPARLFPAMPIMLEKMQPWNAEFDTAAMLALEEADQQSGRPQQDRIYKLFSNVRYQWAMMVGAFRLYVANRSGLFTMSPEVGMRGQKLNMAAYAENLDRDLAELRTLDEQGLLELQQQLSLTQMTDNLRNWQSAYRDVAAIYDSDRWRLDAAMMRDAVQPMLAAIWEQLRDMERRVETASAAETMIASRTAGSITDALWWLLAIAAAAVLVGYAIFARSVLRPIALVAQALKAEAAGAGPSPLPAGLAAETKDLVDAFDTMREQVRSRQERLETILNNAAEGIITFDAAGAIESYNNAAQYLFGWTATEASMLSVAQLWAPAHGAAGVPLPENQMVDNLIGLAGGSGELTGQHRDGTQFPVSIKLSTLELRGRRLYTVLVADISEHNAMLEHLKAMAERDGLTGLYNRSYFHEQLELTVERARRAGQCCSLLYIDLDNFKYVNDTLGHLAGDRLLVEVSGILHKRARKSDLIARLGGDEFTVLLFDTHIEQAALAAESYRRALAEYQFRQGGERIDMGCSIGVAPVTPRTGSAEEVLSRADIACHLAKRGGRNRIHVFRVEDEANVASMSMDMGWSRRIKDAIAHDRFVLARQPIVDARNGEVATYEVLIRMRDEHGGLIMPGGFLSSAERFGLAADIDRWVISRAIDQLAVQRRAEPGLRYSINLSGQTLTDHSICDMITEKLRTTQLDPAALTFEVTETVAISDMTRAEGLLSALQALGCRTALDDFGSGMSSFAYLRDLPVDYLKIDGRFVKNLPNSPVDQAMVRAMNDVAHALDKKTVAEFVEDEETLRILAAIGVDYAQGYHVGRPELIDDGLASPSIAVRKAISG